MADNGISTIEQLSELANVSRPTIYALLNGKSPYSSTFLRICRCLNVNPQELLTESKTAIANEKMAKSEEYKMRPVIKWSGSKRTQVPYLMKYLPEDFDTYYEPFIGGGSMLYAVSPRKAVCGDICAPLIGLWNAIKNNPRELAKQYKFRWERLQSEGYGVYYEIRDNFNREHAPEDLLFLSRTCVNGLIRFNAKGEFNNSLHHTRSGIRPEALEKIIIDWSAHVRTADFLALDYRETLQTANEHDLVYLDPPYFHTQGRYYGTIDYQPFLDCLESLNARHVRYMLSFDGVRGKVDYTVELPKELYRRHVYIPSGNSSFKKVMDKEQEQVYESLYLNW